MREPDLCPGKRQIQKIMYGWDSEAGSTLEFEYNFMECGDEGWKAWRKHMVYF